MKIAIIGQQDFGKAVLEAFLSRGDEDRRRLLRARKGRSQAGRAARSRAGLKVLRSINSNRCAIPEAARAMQASGADIGIMAFVLHSRRRIL